jgi:hypothetical protein
MFVGLVASAMQKHYPQEKLVSGIEAAYEVVTSR